MGVLQLCKRVLKTILTISSPSANCTMCIRSSTATPYVVMCASCAALNSVILGYDIGVMGGAMYLAKPELGLSGKSSGATPFGGNARATCTAAHSSRPVSTGRTVGQPSPPMLRSIFCPEPCTTLS